MRYSKKGAMFGLDARVTLAIFSVLSVITGAALYNSIKNAKVVAIITEMDNVNKAVMQFLIDTKSYPVWSYLTEIKIGHLSTQSYFIPVTGWKGPYIPFRFEYIPSGSLTHHPTYGHVSLHRKNNGLWGLTSMMTLDSFCRSESPGCSVYVCYSRIPENLLKALDLKIDGIADAGRGDFRHNSVMGCKKGIPYDKALMN
ncbi:MAG: hypothetical protein GY804_07125 [Alphaproteobacteria bacterium]|nr:hypothetical protein [Alphaproteobacteria bacterium]